MPSLHSPLAQLTARLLSAAVVFALRVQEHELEGDFGLDASRSLSRR
jgi:hypothetical protein